jgi:glyoxylase-like metal-dependent hydrolase (beta-lactamase superfamily II)
LSNSVTYSVRVARVCEEEVPCFEAYWMSTKGTWEMLHFYMMTILGNGITAVVNTGPPRDAKALSELNRSFRAAYQSGDKGTLIVREEDRIENVLSKQGIDPNKVDYVIVTPFQAYAISNVDLFPNAKICLSKRGWIDFHAPKFPNPSRWTEIPEPILIHLETTAWDRVRLLEDEDTIAPGIKVFWTGVHHRSSLAVCVETAKGSVVFSDCFFKYDNIEKNIPLGIQESLEETMKAYDRIRREAKVLLPAYDPDVFKRHPGGVIA